MISIVIPCHNQASELNSTLENLKTQIQGLENVEVIIVDNNSVDETKDTVKSHGFTYIFYDESQSPYGARNKGVRYAKNEIVALLDAKCTPQKTYGEALKSLITNLNWDIVAGNIIPIGLSPSSNIYSIAYAVLHLRTDPKYFGGNTAALTGNVLIRKSTFEKIGYFEEVRMGEDVAFSHRADSQGLKIIYNEKLSVDYRVKSKSEFMAFLNLMRKEKKVDISFLGLRPPNPKVISQRLKDINLKLSFAKYFKLYMILWYIRFLKFYYKYF